MMRMESLIGNLTGSQPETVESDVPFFTITPRTIRFGHGAEVYPLRNVARVGKFRQIRYRMPILLIVILGFLSLYFLFPLTLAQLIIGLPIAAVCAWGIWTRMRPSHHYFGVQVSSGGTRFLSSRDEKFIDRVLALVTTYLEEQQDAVYHINMEKVEITRVEDRSVHNSGTIFGAVGTGDVR